MSDILISGYYGFKNSGDDTLLLSIIQQLKSIKSDVNLCVLSANPEETRKTYKVNAIKRDNPFALIKALISCKMLLVGGGTLIQDATSTKSLLYYLYIIKAATMLGKKVMLYSNGIGPLKDENRSITKKILDKVDVITLRDELSAKELQALGVKKPKIKLLSDCAFGLSVNLSKQAFREKDYFVVSVRDFKNLDKSFCDTLASVCDYMSKTYSLTPVFVPFQKSKDKKICAEIMEKMSQDAEIFDSECDIEELLLLISGAKLCIGMRLHSLIYSVMCNTPVIGLVYDPKVCGFLEYINQKRYIYTDKLDKSQLLTLLNDCIKNEQSIKSELKNSYLKMREKAKENSLIAIELLNRKEK